MLSKCSSKGEKAGARNRRLPDGPVETRSSRQDSKQAWQDWSQHSRIGPQRQPPDSACILFHNLKKRKFFFCNYVIQITSRKMAK